MPKKRSEASPYESKYASPGTWISAAQWLAEMLCARQAALRKEALPHYFWRLSQFEPEFRKQLRFANALFKLYRPAAVGIALRTPRGKKIYSLGNPWFDEEVKRADAKLAKDEVALRAIQEKAAETTPPVAAPPPQTRPAFTSGKSAASKLKGL